MPRVVLVTGGGGRIGRATGERFVGRGPEEIVALIVYLASPEAAPIRGRASRSTSAAPLGADAPRRGHLVGNERAYVTPRLTHGAS
jgi:NAD(P)-dependent dehydrogenase (short-subunit alcohol dehydrogenase family)